MRREVKCELDVAVVNQYEVEEGDRVGSGDKVMMLEIMKMQFYIEAPVNGTIHFTAALGTTVSAGDVLFTVEES